MSITVKYLGRFGNNIFQYVIAKFLSEINNTKINSCFPYKDFTKDGFNYLNFYYNKIKVKLIKNNLNYKIIDDTKEDFDPLIFNKYNKNIFLHGYFQNSNYYNAEENKIKEYFNLPEIKKNNNDIVMHVRLGDYFNFNSNSVISPDWYLNILNNEKFDKLYIVTDSLNDEYFDKFKKFEPIIKSQDILTDFHFIRSFDKIISSNSTLSWWACFLSEASSIYTFKKWGIDRNNVKSKQIIDLWNIKNISTPVDGDYI